LRSAALGDVTKQKRSTLKGSDRTGRTFRVQKTARLPESAVAKVLEAWYCVPPEREEPVVQVFLAGRGPMWGEVRLDRGRLVLEVFGGEPLVLPAEELREVLRLAEERLQGVSEPCVQEDPVSRDG
jgi:hypothetical protein